MIIPRQLEKNILDKLKSSNKAIIIYGARQVGKTTLVNEIIKKTNFKVLRINADEKTHIDILSSRDLSKLKLLTSGYDLLFIDEAQRIENIGINLKLLIDNYPNLKIIVTGSSSFSLANKISEPLTGRAWTYHLYPISFSELSKIFTYFDLESQLEERLIFGSYPEIFKLGNMETKKEYLYNITQSYLYKDILEISTVKNSLKLQQLLKLLSFQVGNQVSLTELGERLELSKGTVARYIDLLEKSFIIFRLKGFSRNLRKEITKMDKIYFWDIGIRNAVIGNFNYLKDRNDLGALWENFLITERIKKIRYKNPFVNFYFWRIYTGGEIDLIEEDGSKLTAYEFKYIKEKALPPPSWTQAYPSAKFSVINKNNYLKFIV
jgi:predicted AAA+ superfamily ATPase